MSSIGTNGAADRSLRRLCLRRLRRLSPPCVRPRAAQRRHHSILLPTAGGEGRGRAEEGRKWMGGGEGVGEEAAGEEGGEGDRQGGLVGERESSVF